MTLRVFISSVTDPNAAAEHRPDPLRNWLIEQLQKSGSQLVCQESMIETGVNTLVKLARELQQQHIVIHIVTKDPGRVPSNHKVVAELLRYCGDGKLQTRFHELFDHSVYQRLTYTQWEAWLGKFYDRDVVCFDFDQAEPTHQTASVADRVSMDEHLRLLKPHAGYAIACQSQEDLLRQIHTTLLRKANEKAPHRWASSPWLLAGAMIVIVLLVSAVLFFVKQEMFRVREAVSPQNSGEHVGPTVLFGEIGAVSDLTRLRGAAEHDARDSLAECLNPMFQRMARSKELTDADLKRFIDAYLECQLNTLEDVLALSPSDRESSKEGINLDPLATAQRSPNSLVRKLGIEFSDAPSTLARILKELIHE